MKIGTKSVLYGAHCFFVHPLFVALAWWKLYGFPWDPRLWIAFFVHDLGYWGMPNMDGPEGEEHPRWGANLMYEFFGHEWWRFVMYHSRFLAKRDREPFSRLCVADKLAVALEPWWLYLPRVIATGEIEEYMALAGVMNPSSKYAGEPAISPSSAKYPESQANQPTRRAWFDNMTTYMQAWVEEHRDGRQDTWTPDTTSGKRVVADESGTYR